MIVRLADATDVGRIAVLSGQLGYPATPEEVQRRLDWIWRDDRQAVYVAETAGGVVVGWIHVHVRRLVVADWAAEIGGLVVDEGHRGRGAGRLLIGQAERWARERGCRAVYVRSNVVRKDAHAFYERVGYSSLKTSLVFHKAL